MKSEQKTKAEPQARRRRLDQLVRPLRPRRFEELNAAAFCNRSPAWASGVLAAANLAGEMYNASSTHGYDITDCILGKLNLIRRPRRNPYRSNPGRQPRESPSVGLDGVVGSRNQEEK